MAKHMYFYGFILFSISFDLLFLKQIKPVLSNEKSPSMKELNQNVPKKESCINHNISQPSTAK